MTSVTSTRDFLVLLDGRHLCYEIYGDLYANATVFYHHGLPASRVEASAYDQVARQSNIRLVGVDRPGMGRSTFQPNRRLLDWPTDLLALANHLNVDRFAVLGLSGGGPYVLACLHQIPTSRCVGGAIVAGMYPVNLGLAGMMLQNRLAFSCAAWFPWLVEKASDFLMGGVARDTEHPERLEKTLSDGFKNKPGIDRTVWEHNERGIRTAITESKREALCDGSRGAAQETGIFGTDWGFKLNDLAVDSGGLVLWHGGLDVNIPVAMARKASELIDGAELRVSEDDGHISMVVSKSDEVMAALTRMLFTT